MTSDKIIPTMSKVVALVFLALASTSQAFVIPSRRFGTPGLRLFSSPDSNPSTSSSPDVQSDGSEDTDFLERMKSIEIQEVRTELIQKYVELGNDEAVAEEEVDKFLSDPDQSEKFLEMRRYAKSQQEEIDSGLYFQLAGYFFIGLVFTVLPKYINAYKVSLKWFKR